MKCILDTHALVWLDSDPAMITPTVLRYLTDPSYTVFLSVVNIWEMVIKIDIGKLKLGTDLHTLVTSQMQQNSLRLLPVFHDHVYALEGLPRVHKDPFDRLLASQAIAEDAILLTDDAIFQQYPVRTDW